MAVQDLWDKITSSILEWCPKVGDSDESDVFIHDWLLGLLVAISAALLFLLSYCIDKPFCLFFPF